MQFSIHDQNQLLQGSSRGEPQKREVRGTDYSPWHCRWFQSHDWYPPSPSSIIHSITSAGLSGLPSGFPQTLIPAESESLVTICCSDLGCYACPSQSQLGQGVARATIMGHLSSTCLTPWACHATAAPPPPASQGRGFLIGWWLVFPASLCNKEPKVPRRHHSHSL